MKINLILARARNGVIGKDGDMPWRLPEDMAHFKRVTMGCPVIMGRKTWASIPAKFRPLPGRQNIVVTRQPDFKAEGAQCAGSLEDAIELCPQDSDIWIIGGAQIYAQALPMAVMALVTEIDADYEGDAYAPVFGPEWIEVARDKHVSASGLLFAFVTYGNSLSMQNA
jgi:dihydrofolate reductase